MRGKPERYLCNKFPLRIIPAHAGQTSSWELFMSGNKDHPRACGANIISVALCFIRLGSSPRMRGKHAITANSLNQSRIIPAHAGQTSRRCRARLAASDHPRACGANSLSLMRSGAVVGSSPRMRGKRTPAMPPSCSMRIIPAHAGQTTCRSADQSYR